ncbi:unnamed protein product [Rotaria magnacalcarata]|uniref:Aldos-2-ulose dehydratase/isomerase (AUDH) Cupin domain-containing protein n=1 Tax=Rotaria magnacalcarata TaxID=392030 RepID=A0A819YHS3_9BILA|nr:unnamed protein product [Rotaria magnacalcarata]
MVNTSARYILDVYGYPNENGEGPAHYIVCGPSPNKDVYFYKTNDLTHGLFAKWKVSDDAAARIAIADFDYDNVLSFATISYSVPGYYRSANPTINVFYNRLAQRKLRTNKEIQGIKQNHDLLFKVPRPNQALKHQTVAFITINGIILSLDIVPPYSSRHANNTTYIKNSLPEYYSPEARQLAFQFVKYNRNELKENFQDREFYNLKGFEISFSDNDEHLFYAQLWAAGKGVNAGALNHASDTFANSKQVYDPLTTPVSAFEKLELPSFHKHDPLWDINVQNKAVLRNDNTVVYTGILQKKGL